MSVIAQRPVLELFVAGCPMSSRAERVVRAHGPLQELVDIVVRQFDDARVVVPENVVAAPTLVFKGVVVALGTPDCDTLTKRILALLQEAANGEP